MAWTPQERRSKVKGLLQLVTAADSYKPYDHGAAAAVAATFTTLLASPPEGDLSAPVRMPPTVGTPVWAGELPTNAGGVLVFNLEAEQRPFQIVIRQHPTYNVPPAAGVSSNGGLSNGDNAEAVGWTDPWLCLDVGKDKADLWLCGGGQSPRFLSQAKPSDQPGGVGTEPGHQAYWLSFDRAHKCIKYGKGYHMEQTTLMKFTFPADKEKEEPGKEYDKLFGTKPKLAVLYGFDANTLSGKDGISDAEGAVALDRLPLTRNPPPKVKDSSLLSMFDHDEAQYTFSADLPGACQTLYHNVTGKFIDLEYTPPGQPKPKFKLADAIAYSIRTKGKLLYNKLAEKEAQFGYLRVTLGNEGGDGPGIPYVLEIWPGGNGSPIHNHSNACAVIKVLHGSINVHVYNKLQNAVVMKEGLGNVTPTAANEQHLLDVRLDKGDVTWISPFWYQAHKLQNPATDKGDFCATLQCYKYGDDDKLVWPYFDYLSNAGRIEEFAPDSDFSFINLRNLLIEEYQEHLQHKTQGPPRKKRKHT